MSNIVFLIALYLDLFILSSNQTSLSFPDEASWLASFEGFQEHLIQPNSELTSVKIFPFCPWDLVRGDGESVTAERDVSVFLFLVNIHVTSTSSFRCMVTLVYFSPREPIHCLEVL